MSIDLNSWEEVRRVEAAQCWVVVRLQVQQALQPARRQHRELVVTHVSITQLYVIHY